MVALEDLDDFARQGQPQKTLVFGQTGGVMNVSVVQSIQGAREGSGCGRSRRLTSKMKLLLACK
jgi:hypothetical protein